MSTVWNPLHQVSEALELSSFMEKISSSRLAETIDGEVRLRVDHHHHRHQYQDHDHHQDDQYDDQQASELGELGIQDWARLWVQVGVFQVWKVLHIWHRQICFICVCVWLCSTFYILLPHPRWSMSWEVGWSWRRLITPGSMITRLQALYAYDFTRDHNPNKSLLY